MNKKELNKIAKKYEWRLSQYVLDDIKNMQKIIEEYKRDNFDKTLKILNEIGIDPETLSEREFLMWYKLQEVLSLESVLTTVVSTWQEYIKSINQWEQEKTSPSDIATKGRKI